MDSSTQENDTRPAATVAANYRKTGKAVAWDTDGVEHTLVYDDHDELYDWVPPEGFSPPIPGGVTVGAAVELALAADWTISASDTATEEPRSYGADSFNELVRRVEKLEIAVTHWQRRAEITSEALDRLDRTPPADLGTVVR